MELFCHCWWNDKVFNLKKELARKSGCDTKIRDTGKRCE